MKPLVCCFLLIVCAFIIAAEGQDGTRFVCNSGHPETGAEFVEWLAGVELITSDAEMKAFSKLTSDSERSEFIEKFWLRRDPDPDTYVNEFRDEFCERLTAAQSFDTGTPGRKTDRSRSYILFGKPDRVVKGRGKFDNFENIPFEKWIYKHVDGVGDDISITFVDPNGTGEFRFQEKDRDLIEKVFGSAKQGLIISL